MRESFLSIPDRLLALSLGSLRKPSLVLSLHFPFTRISSDVPATFVLMDVQGAHVVIYKYTLKNDDVKVDRIEYKKESTTA